MRHFSPRKQGLVGGSRPCHAKRSFDGTVTTGYGERSCRKPKDQGLACKIAAIGLTPYLGWGDPRSFTLGLLDEVLRDTRRAAAQALGIACADTHSIRAGRGGHTPSAMNRATCPRTTFLEAHRCRRPELLLPVGSTHAPVLRRAEGCDANQTLGRSSLG